jgi:hypothetical protein
LTRYVPGSSVGADCDSWARIRTLQTGVGVFCRSRIEHARQGASAVDERDRGW